MGGKQIKIGVLAMQGAFLEHCRMLNECGCETAEIRKVEHLEDLDGLIIPGGESTTIGKLLNEFGLFEPILHRARAGMPIYGTCAGMILLAKDIVNSTQPRLGLMKIRVKRNGFGRQVDSFETDLKVRGIGNQPFRAVFIRAPYVESVEPGVEVMAEFEEKIVCVRQGNFLASAFHPELTGDKRIHEYFVNMVEEARRKSH